MSYSYPFSLSLSLSLCASLTLSLHIYIYVYIYMYLSLSLYLYPYLNYISLILLFPIYTTLMLSNPLISVYLIYPSTYLTNPYIYLCVSIFLFFRLSHLFLLFSRFFLLFGKPHFLYIFNFRSIFLFNSIYSSSQFSLLPVNGTDYCDITGETDWVRDMIDKHDNTARRSGARIVHFCGHDCVPWDLAGELKNVLLCISRSDYIYFIIYY